MLSQKISKLYVEHFDVWYEPSIHNENSILNIDVQNETIVDTINSHTFLSNGLAKISGVQSPYQSKTIEFNGQTNTGLVIYSPTDMNFDQNDFTVEMLIYIHILLVTITINAFSPVTFQILVRYGLVCRPVVN